MNRLQLAGGGLMAAFALSFLVMANATHAETTPSRPRPIDLVIPFDRDVLQPGDGDRERIIAAARAMNDPVNMGYAYVIDGHTDAAGTREYNIGISLVRANAVQAVLVKAGVDPARLVVRAYGEERPIDPSAPYEPANRRVRIHEWDQP